MKLKKGDTVLIISGKDKGRKGKILRTFPRENKILVEGINLIKKHRKPRRKGEKGQVIQVIQLFKPIAASNTKIICPKCGKATRVGYILNKERKIRICKRCKEEI